MRLKPDAWFYFTVIAFPLFFLLHGVNEQFGLIRNQVIIELLLYYLLVAIAIAAASKFYLKENGRATVLVFVLLCVFFFFGVVKDLIKGSWFGDNVGRYKILLPLVFVIVIFSSVVIKKISSPLVRAGMFIRTLLLICLLLETGIFVFNIITHKEKQKDLGDIDHKLIQNINIPDTAKKPFIFWIVMDEYSGSKALKERWQFNNPIDSLLRTKGFFSVDGAESSYNYTHYSLASTLDMTYLENLNEHSEIGFRDIVRGNVSLMETNTVNLLKSQGYNIHNYTIYNIRDHPTKANEFFINADFKLIDNQTLPGRIKQDIGWNFMKIDHAGGLQKEARYRLSLMEEGLKVAKEAADDKNPSFFMFHYMLTHEPFLYNADGSLDLKAGFGMAPEKYIPSITYANKALSGFLDAIKEIYKNRDLVIILQGDHGYKYDENDPLFDKEGCSILYSVYCSDLTYPGWHHSFNSVNGFRVLFNKYFFTNLPILENRSINLYYR